MLELTLEKYYNNLFYKAQNVMFRDLSGDFYYVVNVLKVGVNYVVTVLDDYNCDLTKILGGHEKLYVDVSEEVYVDDL